ncbi:MAG: amino acid permease [Ferruginibacter sp.]
MAIEKTEEGLERVVGVSGLALTIVNFTIGAGIFVLPAVVGIEMGAFGIFSYIFCAIMLATIMLCYAETGARVTSSGGSYAYVVAAFGELPGFIVNWLFFFGWSILSDAALLNIIADSLAVIFPVFLNPWLRAVFFFVLMSFMILLNIRGAKQGVSFIKIVTLVKLIPLLAIIIFGFGYIKTDNLYWNHIPSLKSFGNTALVLFFAFAGFESALSVSGEIKNPKRTVPMGILLAGVLILIVYLLLQTVTQGVLGSQIAAVKDAPLAAIAKKIIGPIGATILLLTAAFSCFTTVSGDVLATPRLLFAGAKDGLFPKILGKVHPKFATPYWAIAIYGSLIFILSVAGGFKQLAVLASAAILLIYLSVILASIKLRSKKNETSEKTFRMPGGITIPLIGIAAIIWLLTSLTKWEILSALIFIGAIILIYFAMKQIKKNQE